MKWILVLVTILGCSAQHHERDFRFESEMDCLLVVEAVKRMPQVIDAYCRPLWGLR